MSSDPNEYIQERQRQNLENRDQAMQGTTLETYHLEQQNQSSGNVPKWQQMVVNIFALIGLFAVVYVILDAVL